MIKILLIDDDMRLGDLLKRYFEKYSIDLTHALRPSEGMAKLDVQSFDLVILDIMLPEMDGFEVCKTLRKKSSIPIIMLTARGDVMDRVVGLEIGADDYLPKPFEPRELVARIQNILKRTQHNTNHHPTLEVEGLKIDTQMRQVWLENAEISLSTMEYQLLLLLMQSPNKVFTRDDILNALRGIDAELFTRSVDILVSRLRHKLEPRQYIKTIRGSGYCFVGKPV